MNVVHSLQSLQFPRALSRAHATICVQCNRLLYFYNNRNG